MIGAELVCNVSPDDGNGGGSYFGPVASSAAGSNRVSLPENSQGGGGEAFLVMNGTGAGQIHAIVAYNATSRSYTLDTPLVATLGVDSWVQTLNYQGKSHYIGNRWGDNGAFQL